MDIKWIDDFLSLAQTRNFSRSADERNVTQSALSRRIRSLEEWLGADLVDRSTCPVVLTPAGKMFSSASSEALRLLNDTRALLRERSADDGMLRISAAHTLSLNFFPRWLKEVQARQGQLRTRVLPANVRESILSMMENECDLLMCYHHRDMPVELDPARFEHLCLGHEAVLPVSIPNRAGTAAFSLPGSQNAPTPLLAYSAGSYFSRVVERIGVHAGQAHYLSSAYESDMAELLKTMALAGHGLAWLPESCIATELAQGRLVRAGGGHWFAMLEIRLFRARNNRKPALEALWRGMAGKTEQGRGTVEKELCHAA